MDALRHRGPHGSDAVRQTDAVLAHLHFWTTPEEQGERQPLGDPRAAVHLAFDGRLDNRSELISRLGISPAASRTLSDAALVLRAWDRWGEECFRLLLGPFAVVVLDGLHRRVVCARDPLGDRTLFYSLSDRRLAVASEESALLALPDVSARLDEATLARFLAVEAPAVGATFFSEIRELPRASLLIVERERTRLRRYWDLDPEPSQERLSDRDWIERFREVLAESVRCRLRSAAPCGVLMSGGLDSTSVAALAAREPGGGRLRAVSWVFAELSACDERRWMDPVVERYGLEAVRVRGDDAWPLCDPATWPRNPNTPLESLYRRLRERAYAACRESGATVLLSGEYADELYSGGELWLAELLAQGRTGTTAGQLALQAWRRTARRRPTRFTTRSAVARALGQPPRRPPPADPPWLTPRAAELRRPEAGETNPFPSRCHAKAGLLLDGVVARATPVELRHTGRAGIDLRRPYRDRRLVELAVRLPAHLLFRPAGTKWILRQAMAGILPEPVRRRRDPTSLLPLCVRGLVEREAETVGRLLGDSEALWSRYVRAEWLAGVLPARFLAGHDGLELIVPWQCLSLELWRRAVPRSTELEGREGPGQALPWVEVMA